MCRVVQLDTLRQDQWSLTFNGSLCFLHCVILCNTEIQLCNVPRCANLHNAAQLKLQLLTCWLIFRVVQHCTTRKISRVTCRVVQHRTTRRMRGLTCRVVQHRTTRHDGGHGEQSIQGLVNVWPITTEVRACVAGIMGPVTNVYSAYIQLVLVRRWADYMHHEHSPFARWYSLSVIVNHYECLSIV